MHLFLCKVYGDDRLNDEVSDRLRYSIDKRNMKEKQNKNKTKQETNKQNFTFQFNGCFIQTNWVKLGTDFPGLFV